MFRAGDDGVGSGRGPSSVCIVLASGHLMSLAARYVSGELVLLNTAVELVSCG